MKEHLDQLLRYEDGKLYWKENRRRIKAGDRAGYDTKNGYRYVTVSGIQIAEHRAIWIIVNGPVDENLVIDHINRIKNDNRIENLRIITQSENCMNTSCSNIYVRNSRKKKYEAHCMANGKRQYKAFEDRIDAEKWIENFRNSHIEGGYSR